MKSKKEEMDEERPLGPKARATICWSKLGRNDAITPRFPKLQQRASKMRVQGQMSTIVEETYAVFNPQKMDAFNPKVTKKKFVVNRSCSSASTLTTSAATSNDVDSLTLASSKQKNNVCLPICSSSTSEVQEVARKASTKRKDLVPKVSSSGSVHKNRKKTASSKKKKNKIKGAEIAIPQEDLRERRPSILQCIISDILGDDKRSSRRARKEEDKRSESKTRKIEKINKSDSVKNIECLKKEKESGTKKHKRKKGGEVGEGDAQKSKSKKKERIRDSLKTLAGFKRNKLERKCSILAIKDDDCLYTCELIPYEEKPKPSFKLSDLGSLEIPPFRPKAIVSSSYSIESVKMIMDATTASSHSLVRNTSWICGSQESYPCMLGDYDPKAAEAKTVKLKNFVDDFCSFPTCDPYCFMALTERENITKATNTDITWVEKKLSRIPRLKVRKKKLRFEGIHAISDSASSRDECRGVLKLRDPSVSSETSREGTRKRSRIPKRKKLQSLSNLDAIKDVATDVINLEEEAIVFSDETSVQNSTLSKRKTRSKWNSNDTVSPICEVAIASKTIGDPFLDFLDETSRFLRSTNSTLSVVSNKETNSVSLQVIIPSVTVETNTSYHALAKKRPFTRSRLPLPIRSRGGDAPPCRSLTFPIELDIRKLLEERTVDAAANPFAADAYAEVRRVTEMRLRRWFPMWKQTKKKLNVDLKRTIGNTLQVYSLYRQVKLEGATGFQSFAYRPSGNVEDVMVYDAGNIFGGGYIEPNEKRSHYVFSSILRKYLKDSDTLSVFVPCYGGNAFKAPKYPEDFLRNPDPILETISSIICKLGTRDPMSSQLVITVGGDGMVVGGDGEDVDGDGLDRLPSAHGHLMDFDVNMDYIFEIPFDSDESLVIEEETFEEESEQLVMEQEPREEDFTLLLEPSPSDIELVISFSDAEIILILPDGSEESFCCSLWDTSSDVLYDSYNKLFDNLRDNRWFVRRMYRALTKKLSINVSDLLFVDDIWETIIEEDGGFVLDAKKVLQLEAKYRLADEGVVELKSTSFKSLLSLEADDGGCLCGNSQKPSKSCPCLNKSNEKKVKKKRSKSQTKSTEVETLFFASMERKATSDESSREENDRQKKELVEWERNYNEILVDFKTNFQPTVEPQVTYILGEEEDEEEEEEIIMNPPILWILAKRFMRNRRRRMVERRRLLQERRKRRKLQKKDDEECEVKKSTWSILSQSSFLAKNWCSISSIFDTLSGIFDKRDSDSIECICKNDEKDSGPPSVRQKKVDALSDDDGHKMPNDKELSGDGSNKPKSLEKPKSDDSEGTKSDGQGNNLVEDDLKESKPGDHKITTNDGHSKKSDDNKNISKSEDDESKVTKNDRQSSKPDHDDDTKKTKLKDDESKVTESDAQSNKPDDKDATKKSKLKDDVPKNTDDFRKSKPGDNILKTSDFDSKTGEDGDRKLADNNFKRVDNDAKQYDGGKNELNEDRDSKKDSASSKKPSVYFPDEPNVKPASPVGKTKPRSTVDEQTAGPSGVVKTKDIMKHDSNRCKCSESKLPKPQPKTSHRKATNSDNKKNGNDKDDSGKMTDKSNGFSKDNTSVFMLTSDMPMERIDIFLSTVLDDVHKESVSDSEIISGSNRTTTPTSTTTTTTKKPCTPKTCKSTPELKSDFSMNRYINKSKEMIQSLFGGKDDKRFSVKTIFRKKNFLKPSRKEILSPVQKQPIPPKKETRKSCMCSTKTKISVETSTMDEEHRQFVDKGSDAIRLEHVSIGSDPIVVSVEHKETMTAPEPIPTQIPNLEELMKSCECDSVRKLEVVRNKNVDRTLTEKENKSKWRCFGKKAVEKRKTPCECIDLHTLVNELEKNSQVTLKKAKRDDEVRVVYCNRMVENVGAQVFRMEFDKDVQCQSCCPPSSTTGTQSDDLLTMEKFARDIERRICNRIKCWKKLTISTKEPSMADASINTAKGKVKYFDRVSFGSDSIFEDGEDSSILGPLPNIRSGGSEISSILSSREYFNQRRRKTDSMRHFSGSNSSKADVGKCHCCTGKVGVLRPEDICHGNYKKMTLRSDSVSVLKNKILDKKSNISMLSKRRFLLNQIKEKLSITPHAITTPSIVAVSTTFPRRVKLQSTSTPMEEEAAPIKNEKKHSPTVSNASIEDAQSLMNISDILGSDDLIADNSEFSISRNDSAPIEESAMPTGPITLDSQVDLTLKSKASNKYTIKEFSPYISNQNKPTNYVRKRLLGMNLVNDNGEQIKKTDSERARNARGAKLAEHMNFDCKVIKKPPKRTPSFEARAERGSIIADTLDFDDLSKKVAIPLIQVQKDDNPESLKSKTSIKKSISRMLRNSGAAIRRTNWQKSVSTITADEVSPVDSIYEEKPVKKTDSYYLLNSVLNRDFVKRVQSMVQVSSEDLFVEVKPFSELKEMPVVKPKPIEKLLQSPPILIPSHTKFSMKSVDSLELYPKDENGKRQLRGSNNRKKASVRLITNITNLFFTGRRKRRVSFNSSKVRQTSEKQSRVLLKALNFWTLFGRKKEQQKNKPPTYGCGEACTCGPLAKDICLCQRTTTTTRTNYVRCMVNPMKVTGYEEVLSCGNRDRIKIEVDDATCILPSDSNLCPSRLSTIAERTERSSAIAKLEAKNSQRTINSDISSLKSCDADADWYWRNPKVVDEFKDSYDRLKPVLLENVSKESERYIFNKICSIIERNSCPSINSLYKRESKATEEGEKESIDRGLKKSDVVSLLMRYKQADEPTIINEDGKEEEEMVDSNYNDDDDDDICEEFVFSVRNYTERKTEVRMESSPRRGTAVIRLDEDLRPNVSWVMKTMSPVDGDKDEDDVEDHLSSRFALVERDITSNDSIGYCLVPNRNHR